MFLILFKARAKFENGDTDMTDVAPWVYVRLKLHLFHLQEAYMQTADFQASSQTHTMSGLYRFYRSVSSWFK